MARPERDPKRAGGAKKARPKRAGDPVRPPRPRRSDAADPTGRRAKRPARPRGDADPKPARPRRSDGGARAADRPAPPTRGPKTWGSVARKGAGTLGEDQETASRIWRDAVKRARTTAPTGRAERTGDDGEVWVREPDAPAPAPAPAPARDRDRDRRPSRMADDRRKRKLAPAVSGELAAVTGSRRAAKLEQRLADAARAFERDRYPDARRILQPLAKEAPGAASVRELYGVTLYNLGKWAEAARELEAYCALTGSTAQHPVLADVYRALRRYKKVDALWEELRAASPSAELVAEGRIVAAGALADQGDLRKAINLLERAKLDTKRPRQHHLRMMYALADLYERVGDVPRARDLFRRVLRHDRDFFDVADRVKSLQ